MPLDTFVDIAYDRYRQANETRLKTMTASNPILIAANNFEVKSLSKAPYKLAITCYSYISYNSGFGIWDKTAMGWVSMDNEGSRPVPTSYTKKKIASLACSQGLYEGYRIVKPS